MDEPIKKPRTSLGSLLLGALFCIGFPAFWTAIAPVSYIRLERGAEGIRATAKTCLLFWIPYSTRKIDLVKAADQRIHEGEWSEDRIRSHIDSRTKSEDEGFIVLKDKYHTIEISCSPVDLKEKQTAINEFIKASSGPDAASSPQQLKLTCVSNWKFAIFAGVPISMLTVLYLLGVVIMLGRWILRLAGFGGEKKSEFATQ